MTKVWHVVLEDCHDAVLRVCATEEVAFAWRDFYASQKGTECAGVHGPYFVEAELPRKRR